MIQEQNNAPSTGLSTEEKVERCLQRISATNGTFNAYLTVMEHEAIRSARHADKVRANGEYLGPLHGMIISIKDCIEVENVRCTHGSPIFSEFIPRTDASAVKALKGAGAIIIGKTNLHELCYGSTTQNPHFGNAGNPWDATRIPSGSSGGAAISVMLDTCTGALGTDTGGSIRTPAAINGVTGLRPTVGAIPTRGTQSTLSIRFDTFGPLARSVDEVSRMFSVLAGYDPEDVSSIKHDWGDTLQYLDRDITDMTIGLPLNFAFDFAEPEISEAVRRAASVLENLGAKLVDVDLPGFEEALEEPMPIILADSAQPHLDRLKHQPHLYGEDVLARLRLGLRVSGTDYARAERWRRQWVHQVERVLSKVDMILTPTTPITAPKKEDAKKSIETTLRMNRFTFPFTWTKGPGLSVPCGFTSSGLPIGMLISGPRWSEGRLFRVGAAYQRATTWHQQRPCLSAPE